MVVDELVERVKLHNPEEILAGTVTQNFKMLYVITKPLKRRNALNPLRLRDQQNSHNLMFDLLDRKGEVSGRALALSNKKRSIVPLFVEYLFCSGSWNSPEEPPAHI